VTVSDWAQTAAGLVRHGGWFADDIALAKAVEFNSAERRAARVAFDAAWSDPANWSATPDGGLVNARAIQEELAARGWTGEWIHVENTIPEALRPLYAQHELRQTRHATNSAGRKDAEWLRLEAEGAARYQAAKARNDAVLGRLAKTFNTGDSPPFEL
jgi:hypothetical protein